MTIDISELVAARVREPQLARERAAARSVAPDLAGGTGRLLLIAADHPARGALRAGGDAYAMAHRGRLVERIAEALSRPGVDGLLGTADIVEDLLCMGALEDKVVIGSMNRGGLAGTAFEIDDRFTGYDAESIARMRFQGGKMLLRLDPDDRDTARTIEACGLAVNSLAGRGLMAMVEPFISHRVEGVLTNDLSTDAVVRSATVAAGLGWTSAYTWLKLPVVAGMDRVLEATTQPVLLLGGEVAADQGEQFAAWQRAVAHPHVRGLVIGRSLLFPPGDDVAGAVDAVVEMLSA